jgi:hypothetical protein
MATAVNAFFIFSCPLLLALACKCLNGSGLSGFEVEEPAAVVSLNPNNNCSLLH